MEEKAECEGGFDREVRVVSLRAPRARSVRCPGGDGRRRQPDGDVASTHQRAIIRGPVLDVVLRLVRRMDSRLHPSSLVCLLKTSHRIRAPTPACALTASGLVVAAADKHDVARGALRVVYLTERYHRRAVWRFIEWVVVWTGWLFGLSHYARFFDLTVGVCQVRVSNSLALKGKSAESLIWQDIRELMDERQNIFICAAVLMRELGSRISAGESGPRILAERLREKHFGYPATFPGNCVGLGNLLEELLIHLQPEPQQ